MASELESVLARVASGEISPEEALPLIERARAVQDTAEGGEPSVWPTVGDPAAPGPSDATGGPTGFGGSPPVDGVPGAASRPAGTRARAVRVLGAYRSIDVLADPTVTEVFVSGNHTARREGEDLVIAAPDVPPDTAGDSGSRFVFAALPRTFVWGRGMRDHHLTVRVHPAMRVELDLSGTRVRVAGCSGGGRARLLACSLELDGVCGAWDLEAMASSVTGSLMPTEDSRVSCECSSVRLSLRPGTDTVIQARNRMGKVVLPGKRVVSGGLEAETAECAVGGGRDRLTVEALMSSVVLAGAR